MSELVPGIAQRADTEREAAAADAAIELIAQAGEPGDSVVEVGAPVAGKPGPVAGVGSAVAGEGVEGCADIGKGNAGALRHLDEGDAAEDFAGVAPLVALVAPAMNEALSLVEVQRGDGDATAAGNFADGEGGVERAGLIGLGRGGFGLGGSGLSGIFHARLLTSSLLEVLGLNQWSPVLNPTKAAGREAMSGKMKIGVIYGSTRVGRFCDKVAGWAYLKIAGSAGFEAEAIDPLHQTDAAELRRRIGECDGFVVVTPEYNHGYPAPLKELIDSIGAEWQAKPVAFVSYGGISGGLRAVEQLRQVFAEVHAMTIRDTVSFAAAWEQFDEAGVLARPERAERSMAAMLERLGWWASALRAARQAAPYKAGAY